MRYKSGYKVNMSRRWYSDGDSNIYCSVTTPSGAYYEALLLVYRYSGLGGYTIFDSMKNMLIREGYEHGGKYRTPIVPAMRYIYSLEEGEKEK